MSEVYNQIGFFPETRRQYPKERETERERQRERDDILKQVLSVPLSLLLVKSDHMEENNPSIISKNFNPFPVIAACVAT